MSGKLLSEQVWGFLVLKEAAQARVSPHFSNTKLLEITCRGSFVLFLNFVIEGHLVEWLFQLKVYTSLNIVKIKIQCLGFLMIF